MKWVTCRIDGNEQVGWVVEYDGQEYVITLQWAANYCEGSQLPKPPMVRSLLELLESGEESWHKWQEFASYVNNIPQLITQIGISLHEVELCAPIPMPPSLRDFYAFEEHVKRARARRGLEIIPEWYEIPVFYFSNHRAVIGPDQPVKRPRGCEKLDYELEIACVIGREGRDIVEEDAESYIFGYTIMNDWSARDFQAEEVKVGLGPAKGKDFATTLGPMLVTSDELEAYRLEDGRYDLEMRAYVNGKQLSYGNFKDIYYTFAQMIARASRDVTLYPGDVIGSGTVGSGCILELGTEVHPWLTAGDEIVLSITGLGSVRNRIVD